MARDPNWRLAVVAIVAVAAGCLVVTGYLARRIAMEISRTENAGRQFDGVILGDRLKGRRGGQGAEEALLARGGGGGVDDVTTEMEDHQARLGRSTNSQLRAGVFNKGASDAAPAALLKRPQAGGARAWGTARGGGGSGSAVDRMPLDLWAGGGSTGGSAAFDKGRYRFTSSPIRKAAAPAEPGEVAGEEAGGDPGRGDATSRSRLRSAWGARKRGGWEGEEDMACLSSRKAAKSPECQRLARKGGGSTLQNRVSSPTVAYNDDPTCQGAASRTIECVRKARRDAGPGKAKFDRTLVNCGGLSTGEIAIGVMHREKMEVTLYDRMGFKKAPYVDIERLHSAMARSSRVAPDDIAGYVGGAAVDATFAGRRLVWDDDRRKQQPKQRSERAAGRVGGGLRLAGGRSARRKFTPEEEPEEVEDKRAPRPKRKDYDSILTKEMEALKITPPASSADRLKALYDTWLPRVRNKVILTKKKGARNVDYLQMASVLFKTFPGKKWYVLVHDDTYLYVANLVCALSKMSWEEPVYAGMSHCTGANFQCRSGNIIFPESSGEDMHSLHGWVNGGAGVVLSNRMIKQLDLGECIFHYRSNWQYDVPASDVVLGCCVQDKGGRKVHMQGFTPGRPGFHECSCGGLHNVGGGEEAHCTVPPDAPMEERLSYHHVGPADMRRLHDFELENEAVARYYALVNRTGRPGDNNAKLYVLEV